MNCISEKSERQGLTMMFGVGLSLVGGHGSELLEVRLVSDEEHNNVVLGVFPELRIPFLYIVKGAGLGDVVYEQRPYRVPVVCVRDGPVSLLAGGVPDLRSHLLILDLNVARRELNTYRRLRVLLELVLRVAKEQVRFSDT